MALQPYPERITARGVASPILMNVYLDRLDKYVEQAVLPEYNRGTCREPNPQYRALINDSAFSIVAQFQQEFRGIAEYYRLAYNLHLLKRLKWIMERSLTKTLAHKLRISVKQVYRRFQTTIETDRGPRKVLRVERGGGKKPLVARWGGISLARDTEAILNDHPPIIWGSRTEIEERLLADRCELCGSRKDIEVHHIRALKDLCKEGQAEKPTWVKVMAGRQRKTLVVCHKCHTDIYAGRPLSNNLVRGDGTGARYARKAGTHRSGEGRTEKCRQNDNSLAAYSTLKSSSPSLGE